MRGGDGMRDLRVLEIPLGKFEIMFVTKASLLTH